ncbi:MAG: hypothetical protein Q8L48_44445 [Archangium sp.]|nr:hypothetical protein [Archangium sp.]
MRTALLSASLLAALVVTVLWVARFEPVGAPAATQPPGQGQVGRQPVSVTASPAPLAAMPTDATAGARTGCVVAPGQQLAFKLSSSSTTSSEVPGVPADSPALAATLTGVLRVRGVRASDDGSVLVGQLTDLELRAAGVAARELSPPFLVELARDCRLLRFARQRDLPRDAARNQQALVWGTFFTLTPGPLGLEDALGQFNATFSRVKDGTRIERHVQAYESLWQSSALDVPANGLMSVELGAGPWFESIQSRTALTLAEGPVSASLELTRVDPSPLLAVEVNEGDFLWEDLLPRTAARRHAERPFNKYDVERRGRVSGQTPDEALEQFYRRSVSAVGIQETWPDLSAWFEVHPEGIQLAVERLHARRIPAVAIAPLYTAIGKARVTEGREALLAIRRDLTEPPMDRVRATFNLLDRPDVGVSFARELAQEALGNTGPLEHKQNFLRGENLLALGMMAGLRGEPELETVARETFAQLLTGANVDSQVAHSALKALGNLGDVATLPLITPASASGDFHTRVAAAHAFRRMDPKASEAAALAWLQRESHPFVRRQLYITIRRQYFDAQVAPSAAMTRQAQEDLARTRSPIDRKTIIRFLAKSALIQDPAFRGYLVAQARRERDTGILNAFTDILTPAEVSEVLR